MEIKVPSWLQDCVQAKAEEIASARLRVASPRTRSTPSTYYAAWEFDNDNDDDAVVTVTLAEVLRALMAEG